jgi:hypothetical protein
MPFAYLPSRVVTVSDRSTGGDTGTLPISRDQFTSGERLTVYEEAYRRFRVRGCLYCAEELAQEKAP